MAITRRELLRRAGGLGVATLIPSFTACTSEPAGAEAETGTGDTGDSSGTGTETGGDLPEYVWEGDPGPETIFSHGVASGDPLVDSVILWTRVSPAQDEAVESFFEVAVDPEFAQRVAADWIPETDASRDHTIKIDIAGLEPGTTYYYRFYAQGRVSDIGRTRTAPTAESASGDHLRFGVCSCAAWAYGHFHVYEELGGRADLDAVLHLGDYIYEFADGEYGDLRPVDPLHELVSLDDYRLRYRQCRTSRGLQLAHRQHPFIVTWDDHEIANDGWVGGAANHDDNEDGPWDARKAAGTQAYFEWLPLREGEPGRVYRALGYGGLVDLIVLDSRYEGRDQQVNLGDVDVLDQIADPARQLLGAEQEAWLFDRIDASEATWILLAQQTMVGQMIITPGIMGEPNYPLFNDAWDGYDAARRRFFGHLRDSNVDNLVVLTGDMHSSFANELTENPWDGYDAATGEGAVAVEFVTPGVTSPGLGFDDATLGLMMERNPHWRWSEVLKPGYITIDVQADRVQADWFLFTRAQLTNPEFTGSDYEASWAVELGSQRLTEAQGPAPSKSDPPPLAP